MKLINLLIISLCLLPGTSCKSQEPKEKLVLITTSYGDIKLKLYNETPLHRDNFIKLIKEGYFNEKIFHRVIKNFMIQGGIDANANPAKDPFNYTIPAEFKPNLFHKKGTLAAARKGDEVNPERASTANQFYIVQGDVFTADKLNEVEASINMQLIQSLARKYYFTEKKQNEANKITVDDQQLVNKVIERAQKENSLHPFKFTQAQINAYTTIGGAPHLDGMYTVFGEVISGLDVVDSIANVKTIPGDRPETDVKFSIKLLE